MNEFWGWFGGQWGNFVGAAGLVTGVIFYWLSRKPKRFGWQLISSTSIVSRVGKSLPLSVVYDGQDVVSPNVVIIRTGNLGKAALRAHDFDGPVRIEFQKSRLLAASITDASATDIAPELNQTDMNSVSFTPSLLNAGEWINLQFVTDGPLEAPVSMPGWLAKQGQWST